IQNLIRNCSPGIDGINAEYLIQGQSTILCEHLSVLYSVMLTYNHVPSIFATVLMVPVLKKPTLDSSNPLNYRTDNDVLYSCQASPIANFTHLYVLISSVSIMVMVFLMENVY
ncbi:hypothetical protein LSH36_832g00013, partial [Paralvinella palmiformis]